MPIDAASISLERRVALVTGAGAGIGEAIAVTFAQFGADVALCDRDAAGLARTTSAVEAQGRRAWAGVLDVRDASAVGAFVEAVVPEAVAIDIVVNNAGGTFQSPFEQLSENAERALVDENFRSVTRVLRSALPHVPDQRGSLINITSIEAHRAAPGYAVYAAMKAAVESLTKSLALELGGRGIRVNCIAPDAIPTPGVGHLAPPTPLAAPGHVDDVAGAALYLASGLSRFVTGTTLHVDGGSHAAGGWRSRADGSFGLG